MNTANQTYFGDRVSKLNAKSLGPPGLNKFNLNNIDSTVLTVWDKSLGHCVCIALHLTYLYMYIDYQLSYLLLGLWNFINYYLKFIFTPRHLENRNKK